MELDAGGRAATVTLANLRLAARRDGGGWKLGFPDLTDNDVPGREEGDLLRAKLQDVADQVRGGEFASAAEVDNAVDAATTAAAFDWLFEQTRQRLDAAAATRPTTAASP